MSFRPTLHPRLGRSWRQRMRKRLYKTIRRCHWCKTPFDEPVAFSEERGYPIWTTGQRFPTLDHIVPLGQGGHNRRSNLTLACKPCNSDRQHW